MLTNLGIFITWHRIFIIIWILIIVSLPVILFPGYGTVHNACISSRQFLFQFPMSAILNSFIAISVILISWAPWLGKDDESWHGCCGIRDTLNRRYVETDRKMPRSWCKLHVIVERLQDKYTADLRKIKKETW